MKNMVLKLLYNLLVQGWYYLGSLVPTKDGTYILRAGWYCLRSYQHTSLIKSLQPVLTKVFFIKKIIFINFQFFGSLILVNFFSKF